MCTSTVAVAEALPGQPATVIGDSTVERSGIATSVPLVSVLQLPAGGVGVGVGVGVGTGVVPVPTCSRRFGEPVPGLVTLFGVASPISVLATVAGVAAASRRGPGRPRRRRAGPPSRCR